MSKVYAENGYSTKEIKDAVVYQLNTNGDRQTIEFLSSFFADYVLNKDQLVKAIRQSLDPCTLEAIAQRIYNPSVYYYDGRWYFYGDEEY